MRFDIMGAVVLFLAGLVLGWFVHPRYEAVTGPESVLYRIDTWSGAVKVFHLNNSNIDDADRFQGWQLSEFKLEDNETFKQ